MGIKSGEEKGEGCHDMKRGVIRERRDQRYDMNRKRDRKAAEEEWEGREHEDVVVVVGTNDDE